MNPAPNRTGKLRPEVKTRWVEALRSGEYQQVTGNLRVHGEAGDRFCCLGVLCDLAKEEGVPLDVERMAGDVYTYNGLGGTPPTAVREWAYEIAPLDDSAWEVAGEDGDPVALADLNDVEGKNFSEIADVIEESL